MKVMNMELVNEDVTVGIIMKGICKEEHFHATRKTFEEMKQTL